MLAFFAPLLLKLSPVGAFLKRIPAKLWLAIALAAALAIGFVWHQHTAHKALQKADATGYARAMRDVEKKALALKTKTDALTRKISTLQRSLNDAENRRISASADTLRLRGPGRAICAEPAPAPGRHEPPRGQGNAPLAEVPDRAGEPLIALPFTGTIAGGETCDLNRAEVKSWREFYDKLVKAWPTH